MKYALIILIALTFAGCAVLSDKDPIAQKIAVQYATAKVIGDDREKAVKLVGWVEEAEVYINSEVEVRIDILEQALRDRIDWNNLDAQETLIVDSILMESRLRLVDQIGAGALDPESLIKLSIVLGWIKEAGNRLISM